VQAVLDTVLETIATEGRVELRDFGVFEVKRRAARKARNPRSGETVDVPEKDVVTFSPGKEIQERIERREISQSDVPGKDCKDPHHDGIEC
jgi:nucleoid DNA-binding protein